MTSEIGQRERGVAVADGLDEDADRLTAGISCPAAISAAITAS
jgi:hypothetical protein